MNIHRRKDRINKIRIVHAIKSNVTERTREMYTARWPVDGEEWGW